MATTFPFPASPTVGQQVTLSDGVTVMVWDGSAWEAVPASASLPYLPLVGGTLTGPLVINTPVTPEGVYCLDLKPSSTGGHAFISMHPNTGGVAGINAYSSRYPGDNTNIRWQLNFSSGAESTGDVGSDFDVVRFNDAGTVGNVALRINRASGQATFGGNVIAGDGAVGLFTTSAEKYIRFSADNWRWSFIPAGQPGAGSMRYVSNTGVLWICDASGNTSTGGGYSAAGRFIATDALSTALHANGADLSGGTYFRNITQADPSWGSIFFQATHVTGTWAGLRYIGGTANIEFVMSSGTAWGFIRADAFTVMSDERGKEQIAPLVHQPDAFMAIRPIEWVWPVLDTEAVTYPDLRPRWGFSAQNLALAVPLAVNGDVTAVDAEGKPVTAGIDPVPLLALTILEVQDLVRRVQALEAT